MIASLFLTLVGSWLIMSTRAMRSRKDSSCRRCARWASIRSCVSTTLSLHNLTSKPTTSAIPKPFDALPTKWKS